MYRSQKKIKTLKSEAHTSKKIKIKNHPAFVSLKCGYHHLGPTHPGIIAAS